MKPTEAMLIEDAYVALLRLPFGSHRRAELQPALAALRDSIAADHKRDPEDVQDSFQATALTMRS